VDNICTTAELARVNLCKDSTSSVAQVAPVRVRYKLLMENGFYRMPRLFPALALPPKPLNLAMGNRHEKNIPAKHTETRPCPRLPRAHGDR
jgi:hypothetical protein